MQDDLLLTMLKQDLEILHTVKDDYLENLIKMAKEMIAREGITLGDTFEDNGIVVMYAAWMYRKRAAPDSAMPRMIRAALNNKLFSQKATVTTDV
ncbi:MAG: hypothetical protein CVV64_22445 [Candidatus Wallbacteria bacterium HGW-Wallbacteria-1]|jgi:hypothetical protein|uniref:Phage gp6-like head-tail connector protein n=1 Tax=Candidatus Wallbacteria bacterium HGW-Wallbacteria-1 TaxID=2013854 RepID=A0A2N1PFZ3_9BACT|nr:MAG: hypothetical protein CVV64_22445 [Candidatus Wallbacteria bacterium HGW-Wallbacteria-1]